MWASKSRIMLLIDVRTAVGVGSKCRYVRSVSMGLFEDSVASFDMCSSKRNL